MVKTDNFGIVIHGGAQAKPSSSIDLLTNFNSSVSKIVSIGFKALEQGAKAIDAVEIVIKHLEDDPLYNAGTGCCLTSEGTVELDAMIMDGSDMSLGSVACVDFTSHPISLARLVMEVSPHCMMVGSGARRFAESQSYEIIDSSTLITDASRNDLIKCSTFRSSLTEIMNVPVILENCDTVGAVALDSNGKIACGTSTGGINGKLPGRVGDGPLIGCGGYANSYGGASCTGHGEILMKSLCSYQVVNKIQNLQKPFEAAKSTLKEMYKNTRSCGGVICMNTAGDVGVYHSAEFMSWASYTKTAGIDSFFKYLKE